MNSPNDCDLLNSETPLNVGAAELPALPVSSLWNALSLHDGPWLHFHGSTAMTTVTREDIYRSALGWASALEEQGRHAERVGILLPNGPDFVAAFFAAQALGAAAVPLPWPVVDGDASRLKGLLASTVERAELGALVTTRAMACVDWGIPVVTAPGKPLSSPRINGFDGPAFIQFTSGSTDRPKGACISQRAALSSSWAMAKALNFSPRDVGVSWLPFFHDMGLVGVVLTSLLAGFEVHVMRPGDFLMRPRRWWELISKHRASLTVGPNFAYELSVRRVRPEGMDLSSLRCALNGSEPVHRATLDGFAKTFAPSGFDAKAMLPVYGLAEATLGVSFARPNLAWPDLDVEGRLVPSVGTVVPGLALKVVDERGSEVAEGSSGELWVRGPTLMQGYFRDLKASRAAFAPGGWLKTGDLGMVRNGALYVTGREKELVIQAGRKFHPYDIERVVGSLVDATPNGVAAVSRLDAGSGSEALVVVVELRRQSGAIDPMLIRGELLKTLGVRADVIEFVPVGALPRTTSGKVKRRALSAQVRS